MDFLLQHKDLIMHILCNPVVIGSVLLFLVYLLIWKIIRLVWWVGFGIVRLAFFFVKLLVHGVCLVFEKPQLMSGRKVIPPTYLRK